MNDYELGQQAYIRGEDYDGSRPEQWRIGWKEAEEDNYDRITQQRFDNPYYYPVELFFDA